MSTSKATLTYRFEVANQSDTAFTSPVYSKDGVAQGGNGQTSLTIDKIPAKNSYVWRVRAMIGGRVGPPSKLRGFSIGPAVTLDAPIGISPAPNGTAASAPVLTVANARQTGPGAVVVVQHATKTPPDPSPGALTPWKTRRFGETTLTFFRSDA